MYKSIQRTLAAFLLLLAAGGAGAAETVHVAIDTSSFGASSGYFDMQLSASAGVPLATVLLSNVQGFDSSGPVDSWGVTQQGGDYLFRNDTSNDLFRSAGFGGVYSFDLTFSGAADPLTAYVSHFVVSAFAADGMTPLGHYDPVTGALADFSWTPSVTASGNGSVNVLISDARVALVPEPSSWALLAAGLTTVGLTLRRRRPHGDF